MGFSRSRRKYYYSIINRAGKTFPTKSRPNRIDTFRRFAVSNRRQTGGTNEDVLLFVVRENFTSRPFLSPSVHIRIMHVLLFYSTCAYVCIYVFLLCYTLTMLVSRLGDEIARITDARATFCARTLHGNIAVFACRKTKNGLNFR